MLRSKTKRNELYLRIRSALNLDEKENELYLDHDRGEDEEQDDEDKAYDQAGLRLES